MRLLLVVLYVLILPGLADAAPKADLWPDWQAHDPKSTQVIDHGAWQDILDRYVTVLSPGETVFDYEAARREAHAQVAGYVDAMSMLAVSNLNRDQQFAYWVNLYNALTVKVVLDHYPVESIRDIDISPGLFSSGPWGKKLITVEGRALSLDDIEHRILRPIWKDPRIHYAVNCASIGCPALAPEAYEADKLEGQLDQAARGFINHPRAVAQAEDGAFVLSSLYDWYRDDFGKSDADFIDHLAQFAGPRLSATLSDVDAFEVDEYHYDWALNDVRR
ncbi:DUF547 domain-containing protein [Thalassospira sp. HF15]|uniref:DUF547 domain-containing protein n=1 Tax=Thalassospira sp. HF15 TaxID=2722755 RepID=UPI001431690E|nr:DUF547 domain-containing protein [Thalassospira sp. HF15]NIY77069.1 DUF547 domain-containing protein [Thalassospira sp. HF15]